MPRFTDTLNNFINGEVTSRLYGAVNLEVYRRSLRKLLNMISLPQGGVSRRCGTEFLTKEYLDPSDHAFNDFGEKAKVFPFEISRDEKYLIVFPGEQDSNSDDFVLVYDVEKSLTYSVTLGSSNASLFFSSLTDADTLRDLKYAQNGDFIFFCHPNLPPFYIVRYIQDVTDLLSFRFEAMIEGVFPNNSFHDRVPYVTNLTSITLTAGATSGTGVSMTASSDLFTNNHVGAYFAIQDSGTVGYFRVESVSSATDATVDITQALPSAATSGTDQWSESAWNAERGWPNAITFHKSRMFLAKGEDIWSTQQFDIFEFSNDDVIDPGTDITDDDPQNFALAGEKINNIEWLASNKRDILVGANSREYAIRSFLRSDVDVRPQTGHGSENGVQPILVDDVPIFVQRGGQRIREMYFNFDVQSYVTPEVSFLAENIFRKTFSEFSSASVPRIIQMAVQALDNSLIWIIDNNGYLYGCTKDRDNQITAFHRHTIGGSEGSDSFAKVLSIATLPSPDGDKDDLYMLVKRTIDGSSVVHLERMWNIFEGPSLHPDVSVKRRQPLYLDSAKIFRPQSGATFYASYESSEDANTSDGTATGTVNGDVSFSSDRMRFDTNGTYVDYSATDNADHQQQGCIRVTVNMVESASQTLFSITEADGTTTNEISLFYNGDFILKVVDGTNSSLIANVNLGPPTIGEGIGLGDIDSSEMVIELNYDLTNGETRLFVNGKQVGDTQTATGTRSSSIGLLRVGESTNTGSGNSAYLCHFRDLAIFDSVQHTEDHDVFEYQESSTTVDNLDYLEGEEVAVVADGNYQGDFTVSGGSITLSDTYDTIIVGLKYTHLLIPNNLEGGSAIGTSQGSIKRIDRLVGLFRETAATSYGPSESDLLDIVFRDPDANAGDPIELFTGQKVFEFDGGYERESQLVIKGSDPLPCNITALAIRGYTYDV